MIDARLGEHFVREGRARFCNACALYHVAGARCRPDAPPAPAIAGDVSIFTLVLREAQLEDDARRAGVAAGVRAALASREAANNALWAQMQTRLDEQETGYLAREAAREAAILASREASDAREAAREADARAEDTLWFSNLVAREAARVSLHASCYLTPDACAITGAPCIA